MKMTTQTKDEVRYCPFCGSVVQWVAVAVGTSNVDGVTWKLVCSHCKAEFTLDN